MPFEADTILNLPAIDGFEFVRELGSGGMGTVYLARQLSLQRNVAIKLLNEFAEPDAVDRFRRESRLLASLAHPHVVTIFDCGVVDGRLYLVMEYAERGHLGLNAPTDGTISPDRVLHFTRQLSDALGALHAAGIVHRDIKPQNILLDSDDRVRISDFGLARTIDHASSLTCSQTAVGTIDYMAPEQRCQLPVDARADQFALAVVVYELLTGHRPFGVFEPVSKRRPALGKSIDSVLSRALARDADDRFESIGQFGAALEETLRDAGESVLETRREVTPDHSRGVRFAARLLCGTTLFAVGWLCGAFSEPGRGVAVEMGPSRSMEDVAATRWADELEGTVESAAVGIESPETEPSFAELTVAELKELARQRGLTGYSRLVKSQLIDLLEQGDEPELALGWSSEIRVDAANRRIRWFISPDGKSYRRAPSTPNMNAQPQ